jgi:hypothetical protein
MKWGRVISASGAKKKKKHGKSVRWRFVDAYVVDKRGKTNPWHAACGVGSVGALQSGD